jgi:hypothetical protein
MESAAELHDEITGRVLGQPTDIADDMTALDTAVDVFNPYTPSSKRLVVGFLLVGQFSTARFLGGHADGDLLQGKGQKAEILEQLAAFGQGIGCCAGNPLIVHAPLIGVAQEQDPQCCIDQEQIL